MPILFFFLGGARALSAAEPTPESAAQTPEEDTAAHEIVLSATRGSATFSVAGSSIDVEAGYHRTVVAHLQLGASAHLIRIAIGRATSTAFALVIGPTINLPFSSKLESAFFLSGKAGILYSNFSTNPPTKSILSASVGKRFPLSGSFVYRPSFGVQKVQRQTISFQLEVIAFSAVF